MTAGIKVENEVENKNVVELVRPHSAIDKLPAKKMLVERADGNTFNIVRLVAALMVIFAHSFPLLAKPDRTGYGELQGPLAVWIFFVISGFLISGSYVHSANVFSFICSRILRVWPALIVVTVLSAFVIGPLVTNLTPAAYFANPATYDYLNNIKLLYIYYNLPGVFDSNYYPHAVNGSLWSIPLEILMYLCTLAAGLTGLLRRRYIMLAAWVCLFVSGLPPLATPQIDLLQPLNWLPPINTLRIPVLCYFSGTVLFLFKDKIRPTLIGSMVMLAVGFVIAKFTSYYIGLTILLPLSVLTFALRPTKENIVSKLGDYSYGIYLWAFPVQQLLVHFFPHLSFWSLFISASLLSILCGAISWHLIEKPCLSLKKKLPKLSGRRPAEAI